MSAERRSVRVDAGYAGLTTLTEALPATHYFDPVQYGRELAGIWYRNWICVCRSQALAGVRSFRTIELGDQSLLLVRGDDGVARGFHNTCRHRGAALCREPHGRLPGGAIVCPYHGWRYGLDGELRRTNSLLEPEGFDRRNYPLYRIALTEWNGFIFACLSTDPPPFKDHFDQPLDRLDDWKLADLVVGQAFTKTIRCNWKIFWENFNECLHCPGVHPGLSQLVPLFGRALQDERDDPRWLDHADDQNPKYKGGLRAGAESWTMDGKACGPLFPDVGTEDRRSGYVYMIGLPSIFMMAHPDYVRAVRIRPLGPEQTELSVEFLFPPQAQSDPAFRPESAVKFAERLMSEDADICERNQRGLHAAPHRHGVLMPEEYVVHRFHEWVRSELARA